MKKCIIAAGTKKLIKDGINKLKNCGWTYAQHGLPHSAEVALKHNMLEYSELFLFLLVAMTYIEAMRERNVFEALKVWLTNKGLTFRQLFWLTGFLAFFISPIADNLTTALIMGAVVMAVGKGNPGYASPQYKSLPPIRIRITPNILTYCA
jgi:Na+/H+ antiporter NhaD/arsenite permease-like protein